MSITRKERIQLIKKLDKSKWVGGIVRLTSDLENGYINEDDFLELVSHMMGVYYGKIYDPNFILKE